MRRVSTVAMVILLLCGACSGDDEGAATTSEPASAAMTSTLPSSTTTSTTTTTQATTTTATTQVTTTTPPSTTTTTTTTAPPTTAPSTTASPPPPPPPATEPPPPCIGTPSTPLPTGATNQSAAVGDLDGDGAADKVQVYKFDGAWGVNVRLAYGWETGLGLEGFLGDGATAASASAVVDIGAPAALIDLGLTLIGPRFGLFVLDGCELIAVARANGELPDLVFGGGLMHQEWFMCTGEGVVQFSAGMAQEDGEDPVPATLTQTPYNYRPADVVFRRGDTTEQDVNGVTIEDLYAAYPPCGSG